MFWLRRNTVIGSRWSVLKRFSSDVHEVNLLTFPADQAHGLLIDQPFILYNLKESPATIIKITTEEAIGMYKIMRAIRKLETKCAKMYTEKNVRGFCHLCVGQEAIPGGIMFGKNPPDTVITSYRAHGWTYVFNKDAATIFGELLGFEIGVSKGKGGSMHMYAPQFFGGNGIVGAQVPLGAGIGFSHKYMNTKGVSIALYGDGAANQGQIFEAFNMAYLLKLPVLFVCENNHYGMGTSTKRSSASELYYTRGQYLPGLRVNGMDALAIREATRYCVDYIQKVGPIIMEAITYRYYGHSMSDPGTSYRSRDEVQEVRKKADPLMLFLRYMKDKSILTEDKVKEIDTEVDKEIDEAFKRAKNSKELDVKSVAHDLYISTIEPVRGTVPWQTYDSVYDGTVHAKVVPPTVKEAPAEPQEAPVEAK